MKRMLHLWTKVWKNLRETFCHVYHLVCRMFARRVFCSHFLLPPLPDFPTSTSLFPQIRLRWFLEGAGATNRLQTVVPGSWRTGWSCCCCCCNSMWPAWYPSPWSFCHANYSARIKFRALWRQPTSCIIHKRGRNTMARSDTGATHHCEQYEFGLESPHNGS